MNPYDSDPEPYEPFQPLDALDVLEPSAPVHSRSLAFSETFNEWTEAEEAYLWEHFHQKMPLDQLCHKLHRFPDDVILRLTVNSVVRHVEEIPGFGNAAHLALWNQQQLAFQCNPLFSIRRMIRQHQYEQRVIDLLYKLQRFKS